MYSNKFLTKLTPYILCSTDQKDIFEKFTKNILFEQALVEAKKKKKENPENNVLICFFYKATPNSLPERIHGNFELDNLKCEIETNVQPTWCDTLHDIIENVFIIFS